MNSLTIVLEDIKHQPPTAIWEDGLKDKMMCEPSQIETIKPFLDTRTYPDGSFSFVDNEGITNVISPNNQALLVGKTDLTPEWADLNVPIGDVSIGGYIGSGFENNQEIIDAISAQSGVDISKSNLIEVFISNGLQGNFMKEYTPILESHFGKDWENQLQLNFLNNPTRTNSQLEILYKKTINSIEDYYE